MVVLWTEFPAFIQQVLLKLLLLRVVFLTLCQVFHLVVSKLGHCASSDLVDYVEKPGVLDCAEVVGRLDYFDFLVVLLLMEISRFWLAIHDILNDLLYVEVDTRVLFHCGAVELWDVYDLVSSSYKNGAIAGVLIEESEIF